MTNSDPNPNNDRPNSNSDECHEHSIDCAEKTLHSGVAKDNAHWIDDKGDCPDCISLEHELADPSHVPNELKDPAKDSKE